MRRGLTRAVAAAVATAAISAFPAFGGKSIPPYAATLNAGYSVVPLLSVGDVVPETSDPLLRYQMIGIPDGLGAVRNTDGTVTVYMNHELGNTVVSEPVLGAPLNRGAFVSKYTLDSSLNVVSGERAYDSVFIENTLVGPAADALNTTPGFGRFCSAFLAGPDVGFDRPIYLAGEESEGASTFTGTGGSAVAIFDNELHVLSKLPKIAYENVVVATGTGDLTVIMAMEDGPSTPDSQLYMYVGTKDRTPGASVLARNGLDNGKVYVFVSRTPGKFDEYTVRDGTVGGVWTEISNAGSLTGAELEVAADALGAMTFIRPEDGAFSKVNPGNFFFVTTGGNAGAGNELGRLYHLRYNAADPAMGALLQVVYNADTVLASGGDTAISPDNIEINAEGALMIQEDGTTQSRAKMAEKGRDGLIWRFTVIEAGGISLVDAGSATKVATLAPPGRDGVAVGPGIWETSGIMDAAAFAGPGSFLFDVQAHGPTAAPGPNAVEDGQLLLLHAYGPCLGTANPDGSETGLLSGPVHAIVEPTAGAAGIDEPVHTVNCEVVVPLEETLGIN